MRTDRRTLDLAPVIDTHLQPVIADFQLNQDAATQLRQALRPLAAETPIKKTSASSALDGLVKYIPTESITLYVAATAAMSSCTATFPYLTTSRLYWGFVVLTPILFLLIYVGKRRSQKLRPLPEYSSAGPRFCGTRRRAPSARPVQEAGFPGPTASGCVPPLQPQKRDGMTIVEDRRAVTGGVDTHADVHVAAALDHIGGLLGVAEFPVTPAGYGRLLSWLGGFGTVALAGIEGTGSYGAWPATSPRPASGSWRQPAVTGRTAAGRASPTRWTRLAPPGLPSQGGPAARRRAATAPWRRSGR